MKTLTLILALLLAATAAYAQFNGCPPGFCPNAIVGGSGGFSNSAATTPPATPCSGTGLIFNVACNSQYIGIL